MNAELAIDAVGDVVSVEQIAERVHRRLLAEGVPAARPHEVPGAHVATTGRDDDAIAAWVGTLVRDEAPLLDRAGAAEAGQLVLARVIGLGPLEPFLADPAVTDVMVTRGQVWIDRGGPLQPTGVQLDERTTLHLIERVLAPLGRHADRANPIVDARLADGSRVHAVVRPLAVDGPCLTIRRFGARPIRLDAIAPAGVTAMLDWAVAAAMQRRDLRRRGCGQDDAAQRAGCVDPLGRAGGHHRGRGRAAPAG